MATIKTILWTAKPMQSVSGEVFPVWLRLSDKGKNKYFATGFVSSPRDWDKGEGRFVSVQGRSINITRNENGKTVVYTAKGANKALEANETRADEIIKSFERDRKDWSFDMFEDEFRRKVNRKTFVSYTDGVIEDYRKEGRFKRADIVADTVKALRAYDGGLDNRLLQDINVKYLEGFIKFSKDAKNSGNTIALRLTEVRCLLNSAIADGLCTSQSYPFSQGGKRDRRIKIASLKEAPTQQEKYLPMEYLKQFASAKLTDGRLDTARHLFLISFFLRGANWKDLSMLTTDNIVTEFVRGEDGKDVEVSSIVYKRSKTKTDYKITITDNIRRELDWFKSNTVLFGSYLLPIIRKEVPSDKMDEYVKGARKRFNESLTDIAKELNFPESLRKHLTAYSARHSFAMAMRSRNESLEVIAQSLGHKSTKTTAYYLEQFESSYMAKHTDFDLSN